MVVVTAALPATTVRGNEILNGFVPDGEPMAATRESEAIYNFLRVGFRGGSTGATRVALADGASTTLGPGAARPGATTNDGTVVASDVVP